MGPSLEKIDEQSYLAGLFANNPDNLKRWIVEPQSMDPKTLMPDLSVSEAEAEDMAAYLYRIVGQCSSHNLIAKL